MPVYSLVTGIDTEYMVAGGTPIVRLKSKGGIRVRAAYTGIAVLLFHWVRQQKSESWRFDPYLPEPKPTQPAETTDAEGGQVLTFNLKELLPAAGLLRARWEGVILAPAIHIDVPLGSDVWVFLLRSPWFPLKLSLTRPELSVAQGQSLAKANLTAGPAGVLSAAISNQGPSFEKVSLVLKRKVSTFVSEELIGEARTSNTNQAWRPIIRNFDLCLVTSGSMAMRDLSEIARGLGAQFSQGFFGPGSLNGDFLLCDGPLTEYSLTLRGDLGFLRHSEDSTAAAMTW